MENLRTYGRTKKYIDQSALKFTDLLNLNKEMESKKKTAVAKPAPAAAPAVKTTETATRSRRVAAVTAAANLKPRIVAPGSKPVNSKRKSVDESKENAGVVGDVKLFQSSSSASTTSSSSSNQSEREAIDWRKNKRTSESATATAIVNSMSIDMIESVESTAHSAPAPKLKSIVKQPAPVPVVAAAVVTEVPELAASGGGMGLATAAVARPKRVVRILEELDVKKDRILENVKPDNKQKHTASTSTPSGGRRKPLKAPQDVSLIVRPDADQSK